MSVSSFLSNENVQILWEVIIDDPAVSQNTTTQQVFTRVIPEFYERENKKFGSLMEMNKQFISIIIDLLTNGKPQQQQQKQQQEQYVKARKEKITFEELQQERVSQFEKDLNAKQQEFSNAMAVPLPPAPVFSDAQREETAIPLTEMEKMIEETLAQRNLEMQKIQQTLNTSQGSTGDDSWLKGQSTSVKEKNERDKQTALNSSYVPKTIQIGRELPKEVTWGETTQIENSSQFIPTTPSHHENSSIFSKLKVKDPLKELEELVNARFDKLEQMIISISKKE
jgi:hypothetical protein